METILDTIAAYARQRVEKAAEEPRPYFRPLALSN